MRSSNGANVVKSSVVQTQHPKIEGLGLLISFSIIHETKQKKRKQNLESVQYGLKIIF